MKKAKISIITVTYNSESTLQDTINSIRNQNYKSLEYIIIDGGSSDNTIDIIKRNTDIVTKWISEPDRGLYDAMNKGVLLASGDLIGLLNSDDIFANNSILELIGNCYRINNVDLIYGDIGIYDFKLETKIRHWKTSEFQKNSFKNGWHPPHPGLFVSKRCYDLVGLYNIKYRICADFDFMLRAFEIHNCRAKYIQFETVKMRYGGKSTGSIRNIIDGNIQIYQSFKENNYRVSSFYIIRRILPKIIEMISIYLSKKKINF